MEKYMFIVYNNNDEIIALCFDADTASNCASKINGAYSGRYSESDKEIVKKYLAEHTDLMEE